MLTPKVILTEKDAKNLNSQVLAYVGDGVYTLFIRTMLMQENNVTANKLHAMCNNFVQAKGQSDATNNILKMLNENELAVFKRARNYKTANIAKHADVIDYKRATGFEAVLGFLYLTGQKERLNEILELAKGSVKIWKLKEEMRLQKR